MAPLVPNTASVEPDTNGRPGLSVKVNTFRVLRVRLNEKATDEQIALAFDALRSWIDGHVPPNLADG